MSWTFHAARENPETIGQAADYFERAVALDDRFRPHTPSWRAPTANAFLRLPGDASLQERAFVEVERALAIDPDLDRRTSPRGCCCGNPGIVSPRGCD